MIPAGSYGRWAIGLIVLSHVLAYNETGSITVLFASIIATVCGILAGNPKIFVRIFHKFYFRKINMYLCTLVPMQFIRQRYS